MITFRPFQASDLDQIVFREEDERECMTASGLSCRAAILAAGHATTTISPRGVPMGFFGNTQGFIWFLGSTDVSTYRKQFMRAARAVLASWGGPLSAIADPRNLTHTRWLRAMGFVEVCVAPINNHPFTLFRSNPSCATP